MRVLRPPSVLALLLAGVIAVPAAQARTFNVIRATNDVWTIVDPTTVERDPGGIISKTWTVTVQRNIAQGGVPQPGYLRTLTEYDCSRGETRWRSFSAFSRSGDLLVQKDNDWPQWTPANTRPEVLAAYRIVCGRGRPDITLSAEGIARVVITLMASWDPPVAPEAAAAAPAKTTPAPVKASAAAKPATAAAKPATAAKPK